MERMTAEEQMQAVQQVHQGFDWFKWIAGLSLINTVIMLFQGDISLIFGLGITQMIDGLAQSLAAEVGKTPIYIALAADFIIAGLFILAGRLAKSGRIWAAYVALVVYALDALLFLLVADYLSILFHGFAIYQIVRALMAWKRLKESGVFEESTEAERTEDAE